MEQSSRVYGDMDEDSSSDERKVWSCASSHYSDDSRGRVQRPSRDGVAT